VFVGSGLVLDLRHHEELSTTDANTRSIAIRLQTASAFIPAAFLIILVWSVPESPRWLLKKGRYAEAFVSMCALRSSSLEAATELLYANEQVQMEVALLPPGSRSKALEHGHSADRSRFQRAVKATNYWVRIAQLFRSRGTRRATIAAAVVMIGQQLCGM
jgi:hypothetical protein